MQYFVTRQQCKGTHCYVPWHHSAVLYCWQLLVGHQLCTINALLCFRATVVTWKCHVTLRYTYTANLVCTVNSVFMHATVSDLRLWLSHSTADDSCLLWCYAVAIGKYCLRFGGVLYAWVRASWIEFNNFPTRFDLFSLLYYCRRLYMFRV